MNTKKNSPSHTDVELSADEQEHFEALGEPVDVENYCGNIPELETSDPVDSQRTAFNGLFSFLGTEMENGYGVNFDWVVFEAYPTATDARLSLKTGDIKFYDSNGFDVVQLNIFKPDGWKK